MTEINCEGLFLVEEDEVTHIHTTTGEQNLDALQDYLEEWGLEL